MANLYSWESRMMTQAQNMLSLIQTAYSENPTTPNKASLGPTNLELNKIVQVRAQLWLHDSCTPISSTCFNKYTEQKDPSIFTDMLCVSQNKCSWCLGYTQYSCSIYPLSHFGILDSVATATFAQQAIYPSWNNLTPTWNLPTPTWNLPFHLQVVMLWQCQLRVSCNFCRV